MSKATDKNAHYSTVYNVKVKGYSVGMTFSKEEAESWKSGPGKVIIPVPYRVPNV